MITIERIFPALAAMLLAGAIRAGDIRIELTAPRLGEGMFLTVKASPLHVAGRVVSSARVLLLKIGDDKVPMKADGSFQHDLTLDAGINRVMMMAGDEDGATAFVEFHVVLEVGAAVALPTPEQAVKAEPPPAASKPPAAEKPMPRPEAPRADAPVEKPVTGSDAAAPLNTSQPSTSGGSEAPRALSRDQILGAGTSKPATATSSGVTLHALIVGVSRYLYAQEQDLRYADKDAAALAALLRQQACFPVKEGNIVLLQNGEARAETIKASLDELLSKAAENDLFLFYFSGHGMRDARGQLCLLGANARIDDPHSAWSSSVTQADITTALSAARCRNKIMLLDACRSGRIAAGASAAGGEELSAGEGVAVLTAADATESSYESDELEGGIFTHFLLKGMKGAADADGDAAITAAELAAYVGDHAAREAQRKGLAQHPRFSAAGRGAMRLCGVGAPVNTGAAATTTPPPQPQAAAEPAEEDRNYTSYTIVEDKKTLDNVLYTNGTNGDRIRFHPVGKGWIGISARIDGEIFACNGRFPGGSMIEFEHNERSNNIDNGTMHLSLMWDQVEVAFSLADGRQVRGRTLYRTNAPPQKQVGVGRVFANTTEVQHLDVYHEDRDWVFLSGNLGRHIVDLHGRRKGDVIELEDKAEEWGANGVAMLDNDGNLLKGWLQFTNGGGIEHFDLSTLPPVETKGLEGARFDDHANGHDLSFFGVGSGWVQFNGRVGGRTVKGRAQVLGDLLVFDDDGQNNDVFQPGRMLLHENAERIMGEFRFPDKDRPRIEAVPVNLFRSN